MYKNHIKTILKQYVNKVSSLNEGAIQARNLYSQAALGIDNYVRNRERVASQFTNMLDKFKIKMTEFVKPSSTNMIFTEDLKNMIHLAESSSDDVPLVVEMMLKFNSQNKEIRFGSFIFGPVVMRMFHYLDDPDTALQCFLDPNLKGFFDQATSYQILMDLLLEHERYEDLLKVYEVVKNQQIEGMKYPRNVMVLVFAAYYKMNTPESFKGASNLWNELMSVGHQPMRRTATFLAALALNQNQPNVAVEILSNVKQQSYMTVRNIRALALAELGRIEDCLLTLRSVLNTDSTIEKKGTFSRDVVENIRNILNSIDNKEFITQLNKIEKYFTEHGHYTENTLRQLLCSEITQVRDNQNSYSPQNYRKQNNYRDNSNKFRQRRPGISELY